VKDLMVMKFIQIDGDGVKMLSEEAQIQAQPKSKPKAKFNPRIAAEANPPRAKQHFEQQQTWAEAPFP